MGLFRGRRQQQQESVQISFEGQQPLFDTTFKLEYEDILEGLCVAAANKPGQGRILWGSIIFSVFAIMSLPFMFNKSIMVGVVAVIAAVYLVITSLFGEKLSRKAKARDIAAQSKEVKLTLYKTGMQINDGVNDFNISYRLMKMYESSNAFMALLGKSMMLSFPKRCFGDNAIVAREIFIVNLGMNRRYFMVDEKGKIIKERKL